ncbi:GYF domain-containing protein [Schizosaccharomyces japonicus yFS275]|uniref:GYF domain-containing protein n=1 Tax=Schizosaccharomyces japonicus (strain yFS275 / FY16936) TaxID=402676 RepID=B6JV73_SCHJY|nr:GYF domain-containing protein [Schizosaccharomyces japonicus yFS275]EEB05274.1 GYF domain-containing protein [Schizosaccharomyces japonicus yFS275]
MEDNAFLDYDFQQKPRKSRLKIEGYYGSESESEGSGEEEQLNDRADQGQLQESDSDDMFSDKEQPELKRKRSPASEIQDGGLKSSKKDEKNVKFLAPEDIQGQEENPTLDIMEPNKSKQTGYTAPEENSDGFEEEDDESRIQKFHGIKIMPFNVREDMEEGAFDEEGNFVQNKRDPDEEYDAWLRGTSDKYSIAKAKKAMLRQQEREEEARKQQQTISFENPDVALKFLSTHMLPDESILEFIQRFNRTVKKTKKSTLSSEQQSSEKYRSYLIEWATEAISVVEEALEIEDIYSLTKENLQRLLQRRNANPELKFGNDSFQPYLAYSQDDEWDFKWENSDDIYGPYPSATMAAWKEQGYFSTGKSRAYVRLHKLSDPLWILPEHALFQ